MRDNSATTAAISNLVCFAILTIVIALTVITRFHRFETAMHNRLEPHYQTAFAL